MYTQILKFCLQVYIANNVYLQVQNISYVYFYLQVQIALSMILNTTFYEI